MNQKHFFDPHPISRPNLSQNGEQTSQTIYQWQRIVIHEQDLRTEDYYRVGTIYGKSREILGQQLAKIMLQRWSIPNFESLEIDKRRFELSISLSVWKVLTFSYEVPGNQNPRSLGQGFGSFCRAIAQFYENLARIEDKTQATKRISKHVLGSPSKSAIVAPCSSKIPLVIDNPSPIP